MIRNGLRISFTSKLSLTEKQFQFDRLTQFLFIFGIAIGASPVGSRTGTVYAYAG
jgi:hypothetical protein